MNSKYQIFVSSTYNDLKDQRDLIIKAILEMGHIPVGMEMFSAADEEQWGIIKRQIDQSDYYVVVIAHRYGSVAESGISYTEKEYDYAVSLGIPVLGFILHDGASWPNSFTDIDVIPVSALNFFKEKVKKKHVSFWKNTDDLYGKCSIALSKAFTAYPREGWVRASQAMPNPSMTQELARLSAENALLRKQISDDAAGEKHARDKELNEIAVLLDKNKRELAVWRKNSKDWEVLEPASLYKIFWYLGPELMVEKSLPDMARYVAHIIAGIEPDQFRSQWPIPSNSIKHWLADFATLELVQPSTKKKSVTDTNDYWTLTNKGKELLALLRRRNLEGAAPNTEKKAAKVKSISAS